MLNRVECVPAGAGKGVRNRFLDRTDAFGYPVGMGRPRRAADGGLIYHVLNRANARMAIFEKPEDYAAFDACWKRRSSAPRRGCWHSA